MRPRGARASVEGSGEGPRRVEESIADRATRAFGDGTRREARGDPRRPEGALTGRAREGAD